MKGEDLTKKRIYGKKGVNPVRITTVLIISEPLKFESVEGIRNSFIRSPKKYVQKCTREKITVQNILWKHLCFTACTLLLPR